MSDWITIVSAVVSSSVLTGGLSAYYTRNKTNAEADKHTMHAATILQNITDKAEDRAAKRYDASIEAWDQHREKLESRIRQLRTELKEQIDFCTTNHQKHRN